jgi:hypothetical protein
MKVKEFYSIEMEVKVPKEDKHKLLQSDSNEMNFILLTESTDKPHLNYYQINHSKLKGKKQIDLKLEKQEVNFKNILIRKDKSLLENTCVSVKNKLGFLFYDCFLYVINFDKAEIIIREDIGLVQISIDYFLSPTNIASNNLKMLTLIQNMDAIIATDNLKHLVIYNFKSETTNKLYKSVISNNKNEPVEIESFKINSNIMILYEKNEHKLSVVNMSLLFKKFQIESKNVFLEITLKKDSQIGDYGLSQDNKYAFFIEDKKTLRVFNIEKKREIMDTTLYSGIYAIECNGEYITMSMQDKRIIAYYINDPSRPNSYELIKKFSSRFAY